MSFASLLGDLQALQSVREQDLAKSLASDGALDDKKVAAAAADAGATLPTGDEDDANALGEGGGDAAAPGAAGADDGANQGGSGDDQDELAKSFFDNDGNPVELFDATELIKSLGARLDKTESGAAEVMGIAVDLLKSQDAALRTQGEMLKSLNTRMEQLSAQGRGRAAVLSVSDRPAPAQIVKSEQPNGLTPQQFLSKALEAQTAGRLNGRDVSIAEGYLLKGMAVPADIVNRVFAS